MHPFIKLKIRSDKNEEIVFMNEIIIKTYLIHVLKYNYNHISIYFGLTYELANDRAESHDF